MKKTLKLDEFVAPQSPILVQVAEAIPAEKIGAPEIQADIEKMLKVAFGEQQDKDMPLLVGLAAPQIGISRRIILVDVLAEGKGKVGDLRLYINPEITWFSDEQNEWYEGCFSTSRVCGIVSRPTRIKIRALNREGKTIEEEHSGYTARIFQHEVDHLNGKEFVSRITDDNKLHWVEEAEFPQYRNDGGWRNWTKKCSREKWEKIKSGK
jgi:peptide deformylase